jgi:hypothetical protein
MNSAIPNNSCGYNKNTQHSIGPLVMRDTSKDIGDKNIGSSNLHTKKEDNISHFSNDHDQNRHTIELLHIMYIVLVLLVSILPTSIAHQLPILNFMKN